MARPARRAPLQAAPRFTPLTDPDAPPGAPSTAPARDWDGPEDRAAIAAAAVPPARRTARPRRRGAGSPLRSVALGLGLGVATAVAAAGVAFSIVAIPLFFVASTDSASGAHRDLIQKGLFLVALPFGAVTGTLVGGAVGLWYGRGGRLPDHREGLHGG